MAATVAAIWIGAVCWWGWSAAPDALPSTSDPRGLAFAAIVAIGPLAVLAVAAMAARTARQLRADARTIRAELEAMRRAREAERRRESDERIDRIAAAQADLDAEMAAYRAGSADGAPVRIVPADATGDARTSSG